MSEFKGTPGPWEWVYDCNREAWILRGPSGYLERRMSPAYVDKMTPDMLLEQAAPDILAACQQAFGALVGSHAADDSVQGRARSVCRAAIAKALGE